MKQRTVQKGLTLIEILLALIIMVVGLVGILALFPPALESAKISMEETNAAIIAESVAHALTNSVRFSVYDDGGGTPVWRAVLTHDLKGSTGNAGTYNFTLPPLDTNGDGKSDDDDWIHHPPGSGKPNPMIEKDEIFTLKGDDSVIRSHDEVVKASGGSDPYDQFAFSYDVRKINTLEYLVSGTDPTTGSNFIKQDGTPYTLQDLDNMVKLYEFHIHIFRTYSKGSSGGTSTASDQELGKNWIATVRNRVSTK